VSGWIILQWWTAHFGFNYLINNFPETHYFISQWANINWGSQHRNKPRLIHFDQNDETHNVCEPRDGKFWTNCQQFKNSNYKQREAQHCGMIITDCINNTLQDVCKMQPTLQQKAHDLSLFSAAVNNSWHCGNIADTQHHNCLT
jgi:hypothetical protein